MPDATLQAQLDPGGTGRGPRIIRSVVQGTKTDYVVHGGVQYPGRVRSVQVNTADSDNTKEAAIRAALLA